MKRFDKFKKHLDPVTRRHSQAAELPDDYRELQALAKAAGLPYHMVKKEDLIESLKNIP